jgi:hypothetical protein
LDRFVHLHHALFALAPRYAFPTFSLDVTCCVDLDVDPRLAATDEHSTLFDSNSFAFNVDLE